MKRKNIYWRKGTNECFHHPLLYNRNWILTLTNHLLNSFSIPFHTYMNHSMIKFIFDERSRKFSFLKLQIKIWNLELNLTKEEKEQKTWINSLKLWTKIILNILLK